MPKTDKPDRRARRDLDLFVLALINLDVNTPYRLRTVAGLSLGAVMPVLGRLSKAGFLSRGREGARGRREFAVTASGNRLLNQSTESLLRDPSVADFDGVLRTAALAMILGHRPGWVALYLQKKAGTWLQGSKQGAVDLKQTDKAELYKVMRQVTDSKRLQSEATAFREIARLLTRKD